MMNFIEAMIKLKEGLKIQRAEWSDWFYLQSYKDFILQMNNGSPDSECELGISDYLATDWKVKP